MLSQYVFFVIHCHSWHYRTANKLQSFAHNSVWYQLPHRKHSIGKSCLLFALEIRFAQEVSCAIGNDWRLLNGASNNWFMCLLAPSNWDVMCHKLFVASSRFRIESIVIILHVGKLENTLYHNRLIEKNSNWISQQKLKWICIAESTRMSILHTKNSIKVDICNKRIWTCTKHMPIIYRFEFQPKTRSLWNFCEIQSHYYLFCQHKIGNQ